jgi:DNA polymerase III epsilon subunit-like protein
MNFVAIDFETANPDLSSICQVGIAAFADGNLSGKWESLINPEDYFDPFNVSIHGITEEDVAHSPKWREIYPEIGSRLHGAVAVSHTAFDRVAFHRACQRAEIEECECTWLDSARVVRRTWTSVARAGYGLAGVAAQLGIEYQPHDALEDARCAGEVLLRAISESGLSIEEWLVRVNQPIFATHRLSEYSANPVRFLERFLFLPGHLFSHDTKQQRLQHALAALSPKESLATRHYSSWAIRILTSWQDTRRAPNTGKPRLSFSRASIRILTEIDFLTSIACCSTGDPVPAAENVPEC